MLYESYSRASYLCHTSSVRNWSTAKIACGLYIINLSARVWTIISNSSIDLSAKLLDSIISYWSISNWYIDLSAKLVVYSDYHMT